MEAIYEIIPINEDTYRIEEAGVRFFLLEGKKEALLIDSGMMVRNAKEIAEGITKLPLKLLNTHGDIDHIGSNREFPSFYMNPAEASNYYKIQGRSGKIDPVWDGDVIDLGDRPLKIIAIPGHTPGSIAVLDIKNRMLFSGDPVQDGNIYMFGVQREFHAYLLSLKKLEGYRSQFDEIYPSHGSCPISPDLIPALYEAGEKILNGVLKGERAEVHGCPVILADAGAAGFFCDIPDSGRTS